MQIGVSRCAAFVCLLAALLQACANSSSSDVALEKVPAPQKGPLIASLSKDPQRVKVLSSEYEASASAPLPEKGAPTELTAYMQVLVNRISSKSPWSSRRIVTVVENCPVFTDEMQDNGVLRFCVNTLRHLGSESEIAFIAAHEVSHVVLRHTAGDTNRLAEQNTKSRSTYWHTGPNGRTVAETNAANDNATIKREQEQEADYLGVDLMVLAGFNPNGAYTFFDLKKRSKLAKGSYRDKNEAVQSERIAKSVSEMKDITDLGVVAAQATFNAIDNGIMTNLHDDDHKSAENRMATIAQYVQTNYQVETARPLGKLGWRTGSGKFKQTAQLFADPTSETETAPSSNNEDSSARVAYANPGGAKMCLTPEAKRAWHDRSQSLNVDQQTAQNRASETAMRSLAAPIINSGNVLVANLRTLGSILSEGQGICGNWCGALINRYTDTDPEAIDELDAACRQHDMCTRAQHIGLTGKATSCVCDQQLADEILRGRTFVALSEMEKTVVQQLQGQGCRGGCKTIDGVQVCGR